MTASVPNKPSYIDLSYSQILTEQIVSQLSLRQVDEKMLGSPLVLQKS